MTFSPDSDANYQAFLTQKNRLPADLAAEFEDAFVRFLCAQATATGTINSAMVTNAILNARGTALKKAPTF
jgi:hypothetical protein